jgi:predicted Fe-S protein YdhL (DUF1289 family)
MAGPSSPPMTRRVVSPCIGICMLDQETGYCLGCRRTIEEIGRWAMMDDTQRQAVLEKLPTRKV